MNIASLELAGFKSFSKKTKVVFNSPITGIVGPNGSGKSNIAEAIRFVLGEQSTKSMRTKLSTDLIFKGSSTLSQASSAKVTLILENQEKEHSAAVSAEVAPFLVYDEIELCRTLYGDGTSDYTVNGSKVRLKDVQELLALAGVGVSKHTILNQGEADRILLIDAVERRELIEDSLGLRVYQMRLKEAEQKLSRVDAKREEVVLLKKELTPDLRMLEALMEKIRKAYEEKEHYRDALKRLYRKEKARCEELRATFDSVGSAYTLSMLLEGVRSDINLLHTRTVDEFSYDERSKERLQEQKRRHESELGELIRTLGKTEVRLSYLKDLVANYSESPTLHLSRERLFSHRHETRSLLSNTREAIRSNDAPHALAAVERIEALEDDFTAKELAPRTFEKEVEEIKELSSTLETSLQKEATLKEALTVLEQELEREKEREDVHKSQGFQKEKELLTLQLREKELIHTLSTQRDREREYDKKITELTALLDEAVFYLGPEVRSEVENSDIKESGDEKDLLKKIERAKVKLEEVSGLDTRQVEESHRDLTTRMAYLENELKDIEASYVSVRELVTEIEAHIETTFASGIEKLSELFSQYFKEVFQGGSASLFLHTIEKGETVEKGVDLKVVIPGKKISSLQAFSGGERALTSIALLFAMASVSPPPFIVLDETDAPLDEHNARRYGALLSRLSEKSSLIVITHNRETMNHCHTLYGVTLGADGASRLLSVELK